MQKKNVLGTDPLSWLKGKIKKENPTGDISEQEEQIDNPSMRNNESNIESNIQEEIVFEPGVVTEEHQDDELHIKNNKIQEDRAYEPSDVTERHRKAILGEKAYDYHFKTSHETTQKESPATAFVIVYTILLLILGFIVYRDLTKQIDKLDTKLESIEKQVNAGFINYENTKDVW